MGSPAGDVWVFVETLAGAATGGHGAGGAGTISAAARDSHAASGGRTVRTRHGGARAAGPRAAEVSLELLGRARELADRLGTRTGAVCAGGEPARTSRPRSSPPAPTPCIWSSTTPRRLPGPAVRPGRHRGGAPLPAADRPLRRDHDRPRPGAARRRRLRTGLTADCTDLHIGDHAMQGRRVQRPALPDPAGVRRQHHRHHRQPRAPAADGHRARGRHGCPSQTRAATATWSS